MMTHNRKIIYWAGFLFAIPLALTYYINSSFLSSVVGEGYVGIIYTLGSIGSLLALFFVQGLFRKLGGYKFLILITILSTLCFFLLSRLEDPLAISIIFIIGFSLNILISFTLDEFLKIFSENNKVGSVRGIFLIFYHLALISVLLAFFFFLGKYDFKVIYFLSFLVTFLFLLVAFFTLKNLPDPKYDKMSTLKFIKSFVQNRNLLRAYGISLLLQIFYAWMIIYTPIYLSIHLGFTWREIGIVFAVMLLPFIFIPYHLGKYADKFGERKILMLGFTIAALATFSIFFVGKAGIFIWTLILFMTRIGAASIEVMSDAYFFKHIKPENEEFVGVYRSASPVSYIIGPLVASVIFAFFPSFNFLYIVLGIIMLFGVYLSSTIRKSDI